MKSHLLLAGACALALLVGGCPQQGGGSGSSSASDALNLAAFISTVQNVVSIGCGIVPLVEDLATIYEKQVKGKGDNVAAGKAYGDRICQAKAAPSTAPLGLAEGIAPRAVVIDGVTIHYTVK